MSVDVDSKSQPMSLPKLDRANKIVNLKVLAVGSSAHTFVAEVHRATNPNAQPPAPSPSSIPTSDYLAIRMGDIRGYQTLIHLFGISDSRIAEVARSYYPQMDGVVVAESGDALDGPLSPPPLKVPVVVYGSPALTEQIRRAVPETTVTVMAPDASDCMTVIKAIARPMLQALTK
jgi:hypothetical protein